MHTVDTEVIKIVEAFKTHKVCYVSDLKKTGLKYKRIGDGAFRKVYLIENKVVAKFPKEDKEEFSFDDYKENVAHAVTEINAIRNIKKYKKYKALRPFVPEMFYANKKTGIVLMERCRKVKYTVAHITASTLATVMHELLGNDADIESYNIAETMSGVPKILDFGMFNDEKRTS